MYIFTTLYSQSAKRTPGAGARATKRGLGLLSFVFTKWRIQAKEIDGRPVIKTRHYFNFITRDSLCNIVASAVRILIFSFRRYSLISNDCIYNYVMPELSDIPLQFIGRSLASFSQRSPLSRPAHFAV